MANSHLLTVRAEAYAGSRDPSALGDSTHLEFEDEMLKRAEAKAAPGESSAAALSRLCRTDATMRALAKAAYAAHNRLQATMSPAEQLDVLRKQQAGGAPVTKAAPSPDDDPDALADLLDDMARVNKRAGESHADAYHRLSREDDDFKAALAKYDALFRKRASN